MVPLKSSVRAVDALGVLTIVAYGTWFYGFGVLVGDVGDDLGVGVGALGVVYGLTTLAGGIGAMYVGRLLDQVQLDLIFLCLGPAAAVTYAGASFAPNFFVFAILHISAGGGIAATGFYSVTQPLVVQLRADDPMRGITRLTIWGAFSSPIAIPLTELTRDGTSWRTAVRLSAAILVMAYFGAGWLARGRVSSAVRSPAKVWTVAKETMATPLLRCYVAAAFFSSMAVAVLLVYQVQTMKWAGLSAAAAASFAGARGCCSCLGGFHCCRWLTGSVRGRCSMFVAAVLPWVPSHSSFRVAPKWRLSMQSLSGRRRVRCRLSMAWLVTMSLTASTLRRHWPSLDSWQPSAAQQDPSWPEYSFNVSDRWVLPRVS